MNAEFRPFFFPEAGYIVSAVGIWGLGWALSHGRRDLKDRLRKGAPVTLVHALGIIFLASALPVGLSLVIQSSTLFWWGAGIGGTAAVVGVILATVYDDLRSGGLGRGED